MREAQLPAGHHHFRHVLLQATSNLQHYQGSLKLQPPEQEQLHLRGPSERAPALPALDWGDQHMGSSQKKHKPLEKRQNFWKLTVGSETYKQCTIIVNGKL